MTIPANSGAENNWGSIPVTPVWGGQGGPYTVSGSGANALPVQGPTAAGNPAVANPQLGGGLDGNGNVQSLNVNQDLTLLASAARTATTSSAAFTNQNARGAVFTLCVTAASGTGGLKLQLQYQDAASGNWITVFTASAYVTSVTNVFYLVYPGDTATGNNATQVWSVQLPRTWRISVLAGDSSSYTYSLGASLIL